MGEDMDDGTGDDMGEDIDDDMGDMTVCLLSANVLYINNNDG